MNQNEIKTRLTELNKIRQDAAATLSACDIEMRELRDALRSSADDTPATIEQKNNFLRQQGLLPKKQ